MGVLEVWDNPNQRWIPLGVELPAALVPHGEFVSTVRQPIAASGWTPREGWEEEPGSNANGAQLTGIDGLNLWFIEKPGLYRFTAYDTYDGTTYGGIRRAIRLVKNGVEIVRNEASFEDPATGADMGLAVSTRVWMDAMDSIGVELWHNSNDPSGLFARSNAGYNRFVFRRVLE